MTCKYGKHEVDQLVSGRRMCRKCFLEYQSMYRACHRKQAIEYQRQYRAQHNANRRYNRLRVLLHNQLKHAV